VPHARTPGRPLRGTLAARRLRLRLPRAAHVRFRAPHARGRGAGDGRRPRLALVRRGRGDVRGDGEGPGPPHDDRGGPRGHPGGGLGDLPRRPALRRAGGGVRAAPARHHAREARDGGAEDPDPREHGRPVRALPARPARAHLLHGGARAHALLGVPGLRRQRRADLGAGVGVPRLGWPPGSVTTSSWRWGWPSSRSWRAGSSGGGRTRRWRPAAGSRSRPDRPCRALSGLPLLAEQPAQEAGQGALLGGGRRPRSGCGRGRYLHGGHRSRGGAGRGRRAGRSGLELPPRGR